MEINTRDRSELKAYFVRNAIPTESNFGELIDGMLNFKDDGLVKRPDSPLIIEGVGSANAGEKPVINFYSDFSSETAEWIVNLNPFGTVNNASTAKVGFNIADGNKRSRLFIDRDSGHIGLGTIEPKAKLHIINASQNSNGNTLILGPTEGSNLRLGYHTNYSWVQSHGLKPIAINPSGNRVGIGTTKPNRALTVFAKDAAYVNVQDGTRTILMGADGAGGIVSVMSNHPLVLRTGGNKEKMRINANGNVGIGTTNPTERLHVEGRVRTSNLTLGSWPANPSGYVFFGTNKRDQSDSGNYALLQHGSNGRTYLNSPQDIRFRIKNADHMVLSNSGLVGLGISSPTAKLHVNGSIRLTGTIYKHNDWGVKLSGDKDRSAYVRVGELWGASGIYGNKILKLGSAKSAVRYRGTFAKDSSRTLKNNIQDITFMEALKIMDQLNPVTYLLNSDTSNRPHAGFIAEDVPSLISTLDGAGVIDDHILAILTKVVKEQQKMIKELREKFGLSK